MKGWDLHLTMPVDTWVLAVRGQFPLCQKNRVPMAGCCWQSMYGGGLDYLSLLTG